MLKVIKELLLKIIDSIDAGNSNITEKEAFEIIEIIKHYTDTTQYYNRTHLAINSQYHNYICLFKQWFDENDVDCKIIQSAIHYWFNDDDWAYKDKVQKFFK